MIRRDVLKGAAAALMIPSGALGADTPLRAIARRAWIYGIPLQETARVRAAFLDKNRPNTLFHERALATPKNQFVTTPNVDTLYSRSSLDLDQGPVRLTIPATGQRYFSVALMDMYSNNFAVLGTRTTKGEGRIVTIVGPGMRSDDPGAIRSPTRWVWLLARTLIDGPADLAAAHEVQDAIRIEAGQRPVAVARGAARSADAGTFFAALSTLLRENPPPDADRPILGDLAPLGLIGDRPFALGERSAADRAAIEAGVADARALILTRRPFPGGAGWLRPKADLGDFGTDYPYRAIISVTGLAALPVAEAMYLRATAPGGMSTFDPGRDWHWRLPGDAPRLAKAFWSMTMYQVTDEGQQFLAANAIDRYAIGDRTPGLRRGPDGSTDIWISARDPGPDRRSNWLPAPAGRPFALTLRAYLPDEALVGRTWQLPPIMPVPAA